MGPYKMSEERIMDMFNIPQELRPAMKQSAADYQLKVAANEKKKQDFLRAYALGMTVWNEVEDGTA